MTVAVTKTTPLNARNAKNPKTIEAPIANAPTITTNTFAIGLPFFIDKRRTKIIPPKNNY